MAWLPQKNRTDSQQRENLSAGGRGNLERPACVLEARIAGLAETRPGKRFVFRRGDSLAVHHAHVEASRSITRVAGLIENLHRLAHVFGHAFPEKITFPQLSAAARIAGRTALLEQSCRVLEVA